MQRKVLTQPYSLDQTFGHPTSFFHSEPQQTRIKIHPQFQQSYLQSRLSKMKSNLSISVSNNNNMISNPNQKVSRVEREAMERRRNMLKEQVHGEVKVVNVERKINGFLKGLIKEGLVEGNEEKWKGKSKEKKVPVELIKEYLKEIGECQEQMKQLEKYKI